MPANPARAGERPGNVRWCAATSRSAMKVSLQRAASESESESVYFHREGRKPGSKLSGREWEVGLELVDLGDLWCSVFGSW